MGFGSYDESEQQDQTVDASEEGAVKAHETDFDGSVEFDADATTDELLGTLSEIKEQREDETDD